MAEQAGKAGAGGGSSSAVRGVVRGQALQAAVEKRAAGVPTYSVPEAAALLSISQEYLYRLIQAGGFPVIRLRLGAGQGRYVIPAKAVEQLLDGAAGAHGPVDVADVVSGRGGVA